MEITVVIPTYNRYEFLKRAINSVLVQTYSVEEIIVVDDGSTDNSSQIKRDFPSIIYIYQKNNGVSSARNLGIKKAKNEWIAFLDSDDTWHPKKIEEQVSFHANNSDILMSYTDERWIRNDKEVKVPKKYAKVGGEIFQACLSHCIIAPSSTLMHRDIFEKYGTFDENLEVCEDYDLWLRIALYEKIGVVNKKLITKYAGHPEQLSFKYWGMDRFRTQSLEKLLQNCQDKEKSVRVHQELLQKYMLLLQGARKYDKMADIEFYETRIKVLQ